MFDINAQVEYWNRAAGSKRFSHPLPIDRLAQWVGRDSRIVDVGCGYGRTLDELRAAGWHHVVGADVASAMVESAAARGVVAPRVAADARHLPFHTGCADAALLIAVLTCIPTDQGQLATLSEIRRIVRRGGIVLISDLWLQDDARNRARYERDVTRFNRYGVFELDEGVVVRHHDEAWLSTLTSGFDTLELKQLDVVTMNGNVARAFQWIGRR